MLRGGTVTAPTVESTDLETALVHIAAERVVWLRVGAVRSTEGGWVAASVEITSGTWPPSWEGRSWEYPAALFVGEQLSGEEIATAVRSSMGIRCSCRSRLCRHDWEDSYPRSRRAARLLDVGKSNPFWCHRTLAATGRGAAHSVSGCPRWHHPRLGSLAVRQWACWNVGSHHGLVHGGTT